MSDGFAERLARFVEKIGDTLGNDSRKASFACYAIGLLSDGERKSMEPMAARSCPDMHKVDAAHQRMQHFVTNSNWSDQEVRKIAAQYAIERMTQNAPVDAWIIDDTGFLKKGTHSVGVQRQYTGSAGKIANCQIGISLTVATTFEQVPIDFELYLPQKWTDDPALRTEARIPESVVFKTKIELALDIIKRALENGIPRGTVLADCLYGDVQEFRETLQAWGLEYGVGVRKDVTVSIVDGPKKYQNQVVSLETLASRTPLSRIRRVTWREGTKAALSSQFSFHRVVPCHSSGIPLGDGKEVWLITEWETQEDQEQDVKFYLSNLPKSMSRKQLIRRLKQRWRTERIYQELKGELGLDHFEGRRYRGWHHHVSVTLCCYAFIAAERSAAFSPSGWSKKAYSKSFAA